MIINSGLRKDIEEETHNQQPNLSKPNFDDNNRAEYKRRRKLVIDRVKLELVNEIHLYPGAEGARYGLASYREMVYENS